MKRAVDIVLLPPASITKEIVAQNARAVTAGTATIDLHVSHRFPHLSLLMGVLDDTKEADLLEALHTIAKDTPPLVLSFTEKKHTALHTANNGPLKILHTRIVETLDQFLTHDPKPGMYYNTPYVDEWVAEFVSHHSFEKFEPHITVHSEQVDIPLPISGVCTQLALCDLGAYNTCEVTRAVFELTHK